MEHAVDDTIRKAIASMPAHVLTRSGSIFYSGMQAFSSPRKLYILGLNPGGRPEKRQEDTVARHWERHVTREKPWSEYCDESWEGREPGTYGIQVQIRHLLKQLDLDPRLTPSANVVFARTRDEKALKDERAYLLNVCWPVHQAVIEKLGVKVVLCLGKTAGSWASFQLQANRPVGRFVEKNRRGWVTSASSTRDGVVVISATHPARADWRNPVADPTPFIKSLL